MPGEHGAVAGQHRRRCAPPAKCGGEGFHDVGAGNGAPRQAGDHDPGVIVEDVEDLRAAAVGAVPTSACQHWLGMWPSKRFQAERGRLCGWGVTNPRRERMHQIVDPAGTFMTDGPHSLQKSFGETSGTSTIKSYRGCLPINLETAVDVGRVGSLFIRAMEPMLGGDDMAFVMKFRDNYDPDRLWASYDSLLRQNPGLQVVLRPFGKSFSWVPIDSAELNAALERQRQRFPQLFSLEKLLSPGDALTPALPVRISQMGGREVCFQMSHALSDGRGALQWIEYWLAATNGESVPVGQTAGRFDSTAPLTGLALLPFYILGYLARAGLNQARKTVDLTHGKAPIRHDNGAPIRHDNDYASRTYPFSEPETSRILAKARALDLSLTQYMCVAVAEAMLSAQPEKSRVCIAVPTDLARYSPGLPRTVPGNYAGSMTVQLRRGAPLQSQIARQFGWFRWGVDYWLTRLGGAFSHSEQRLLNNVARTASLPIDQRGPFQNLSCAVTNVGDIKSPAICDRIESGTGTTKTQTILFTVFRLHGRLTTNVTFARDLYDPEEVFRVADAALANLGR